MRRHPQHGTATIGSDAPARDRRRSARAAGERGAVLVHVAVATMGLLAFSALSIDLGTLWVARAQAQNAADAAALSGGVSLAYIDETNTDAAAAAAGSVAQAHTIWGAPVAPSEVNTAVGPCPTGSPGVAGACIQVVVSRDGASGTPLPVFFSRLFGVTGNDMHASASAKVMLGNMTSCPRPLAISDRWNDSDGTWTIDDTFDRYDASGAPTGVDDVYGTGAGWTLANIRPSASLTFRLPVADHVSPLPLAGDQLVSFDLARPGGDPYEIYRYQQNLESCGAAQLAVGQVVPAIYAHRSRYTAEPLALVVAADAGAYWDDGLQAVRGSAFAVSPRLLTIAMIDPDHYSQQDRTAGVSPALRITNLVGFFLEDVRDDGGSVAIRGRLARTAGMYSGSASAPSEQASFLRTVALVR